MRSYKLLSLIISVTMFVPACSGTTFRPSPSSGALTANASLNGAPQRPFDRQMLMVSGLQSLNEFIRSDVRSKMDEEPVGDTDADFDAGSVSQPIVSETEERSDSKNEARQQPQPEEQQQNAYDEDTSSVGASDMGKFLWAKKSFGEAVKSSKSGGGVIVLYADENIYDINALLRFIEEGRNRIAQDTEVPVDRMHVIFGGYRGMPQVEYWIVAEGAALPELKVEDRTKASAPEN